MSELKLPPQNLEAEQSVLGSILIDTEAIYKVAEFLIPENFYKVAHNIIFEAMRELFNERKSIDVLTLSSQLKTKKQLEKVGGTAYLTELVNSVPTAAHIEDYAKIIREASVRRRMISLAAKFEEMAYSEEKELSDLLDEAEGKLINLAQNYTESDFVHISTLLEEAYERAEALNKDPSKLRGIPTGFNYLDNLLGGFQRSDLVILAARPSVGKTTMAMDFVRHAAIKAKSRVAIFSLEMSSTQLMDRLLSVQAHIGLWDLRMGKIKDELFPMLADAMGVLSETSLYIDDTPGISIMDMRTKARKLQVEKGLDMIIVDYLQLIRGRNTENRVQEVSDISRSLKGLARELDIPVVALAQLSRAVEQRTDGIPQLSDLRDSGSIEQDADVVMFLSRLEEDEAQPSDNLLVLLQVAKHRNGPTGSTELYFVKDQVTFKEVDRVH